MARISTTTAKFNPFTMEELYAPVLRATEKHLEQQEKYDELANQAEVWKYRIDPESTQALTAYNTFMDNINAMTEDLNNNGMLSPSARDNFSSLRRSNPIPMFEEAWTRQQADEQFRREHPDLIFEAPNNFDNYLTNKVNSNSVSQEQTLNRGVLSASAISRTLAESPEYKDMLGHQYYQKIEKEGIPLDVLQAAMYNNPNLLTADKDGSVDQKKALFNLVRNTYENDTKALGYYSWENQGAKDRLDANYWEGMMQGVQTTKYGEMQNRTPELNLQRAENNRAQEKWNMEKKEYNRTHNNDGSIKWDVVAKDYEEKVKYLGSTNTGKVEKILKRPKQSGVVTLSSDRKNNTYSGMALSSGDGLPKDMSFDQYITWATNNGNTVNKITKSKSLGIEDQKTVLQETLNLSDSELKECFNNEGKFTELGKNLYDAALEYYDIGMYTDVETGEKKIFFKEKGASSFQYPQYNGESSTSSTSIGTEEDPLTPPEDEGD